MSIKSIFQLVTAICIRLLKIYENCLWKCIKLLSPSHFLKHLLEFSSLSLSLSGVIKSVKKRGKSKSCKVFPSDTCSCYPDDSSRLQSQSDSCEKWASCGRGWPSSICSYVFNHHYVVFFLSAICFRQSIFPLSSHFPFCFPLDYIQYIYVYILF